MLFTFGKTEQSSLCGGHHFPAHLVNKLPIHPLGTEYLCSVFVLFI